MVDQLFCSLEYLEGACERAKDKRMSLFGPVKTSKAEAAEMILLAAVPALIQELKELRNKKGVKSGPG